MGGEEEEEKDEEEETLEPRVLSRRSRDDEEKGDDGHLSLVCLYMWQTNKQLTNISIWGEIVVP